MFIGDGSTLSDEKPKTDYADYLHCKGHRLCNLCHITMVINYSCLLFKGTATAAIAVLLLGSIGITSCTPQATLTADQTLISPDAETMAVDSVTLTPVITGLNTRGG